MVRRGSTVRVRQRASINDLRMGILCCLLWRVCRARVRDGYTFAGLAGIRGHARRLASPRDTRGVQKLCQSRRVSSSNSIRRRLGFAGYQRLISRDRLWAARRTDRARLTSTRRIWYSRARVKLRKAYRKIGPDERVTSGGPRLIGCQAACSYSWITPPRRSLRFSCA
jgi:hypothetical protein